MSLSRCSVYTVTLAFLVIALLMWPAFVLASAVFGYLFSDAELLANFVNQPKRLLLDDFFEGYRNTLPYTASMGVLSAFILLLYRNTVFQSILVVAIPALIIAILLAVYLPMSLITVMLVAKTLFIFLFIYAFFAYVLQRCGHE